MADIFHFGAEDSSEKFPSQFEVNFTSMEESTPAWSDEVIVQEEEEEEELREDIFMLDFTNAEIRRFLKAYKKFGSPLDRLEAVARDSSLVDKSMADLKGLGELIHTSCATAVQAHEEHLKENPSEAKDPRRGINIKISGVPVNARSIVQNEEKLEPLHRAVPSNRAKRNKFQLTCPVNIEQFDTDWNLQDDVNLLLAIYKHGYGNWNLMKTDPDCKLLEKILPDDPCKKPQSKELQARANYLLKLLKQEQSSKRGKEASVKKIKVLLNDNQGNHISSPLPLDQAKVKKRKPPLGKESVVLMDEHHIAFPHLLDSPSEVVEVKKKPRVKKESIVLQAEQETHITDESLTDNPSEEGKVKDDKSSNGTMQKKKENRKKTGEKQGTPKKEKKDGSAKEKKVPKPKKAAGMLRITAAGSEVVPIEEDGELDPETFNSCKDYMRPVRKALKQLDKPAEGLPDQRHIQHMRDCLLKIGDQITECLKTYNDPEHVKTWRRNLWNFVSKFTEFDARKLHRIYRMAHQKRPQPVVEKKEKEREKRIPKRVRPVRPEPSSSSRDSTGSAQLSTSQSTAHPNGQHRKQRQPSNERHFANGDGGDRQRDSKHRYRSSRNRTRDDRHLPYDPHRCRDRRPCGDSYHRNDSSPRSPGYSRLSSSRYSNNNSPPPSREYSQRSSSRHRNNSPRPRFHEYSQRSSSRHRNNSPHPRSPVYSQRSSRRYRDIPPRSRDYSRRSPSHYHNDSPQSHGYPYHISNGYRNNISPRKRPYDQYGNDRNHTRHQSYYERHPDVKRRRSDESRLSNRHRDRARFPDHERSGSPERPATAEHATPDHNKDNISPRKRPYDHYGNDRNHTRHQSYYERHPKRRSDESCLSNHHRDRARSPDHEHGLPGPATADGPATVEHATAQHVTPEHTTPEHTTPKHNKDNISPRKRPHDQYGNDRNHTRHQSYYERHPRRPSDESRLSNHHQDRARSPDHDLRRIHKHRLPDHEHGLPGPATLEGPATAEHATAQHVTPEHTTPEHNKDNISPRKRPHDQYGNDRNHTRTRHQSYYERHPRRRSDESRLSNHHRDRARSPDHEHRLPGPATPEGSATAEHATPEHTTPDHNKDNISPRKRPHGHYGNDRNHTRHQSYYERHPDVKKRRSDESRLSNHHQDRARSPAHDLGIHERLPGPAAPEHTTPQHVTPEHTTPDHNKQDIDTVMNPVGSAPILIQ